MREDNFLSCLAVLDTLLLLRPWKHQNAGGESVRPWSLAVCFKSFLYLSDQVSQTQKRNLDNVEIFLERRKWFRDFR